MSIGLGLARLPSASIVSSAQTAPAAASRPARSPSAALSVASQGTRPSTSVTGVPDGSSVSLDPASGRVVFEYFDASGALTSSTPSRQQLEAYRLAASSGQTAATRA